MKLKYIFTCLVLAILLLSFNGENNITDCKCKGISLYGRVKVVETHADFNVRIVEQHPDLRVQKVSGFANECGRWQFVETHPDFTVRFVKTHPDFDIIYVSSHPGIP
jgi:hypothetical protein